MSQYIDPIHLRQVLTEHYDLGELHTLCFDLGIDYEEIGGSGKTEKVVELVAFAQRHNRLDDIAAYVRRTRPTVPLKMTDTLPPLPAAGVGSGASITLHVAGDYVHGDKVGGDKVMGDKHDHHHYRERPAYEPLPLPPQGELPAPGVIPPYSRMALGRNPHFVGREPELHELAARLLYASDGEAQAITTHGIGGMGKSQLAVEYAHRFGRFYHSVYWLNFAEPDSIPAEIAACGLKMAARPDDFARYPLAVQVSQTHNEWGGGRLILLIFDNCEDPNLLKQWRPQAGRCRILLTSRRAAWSSHLAQTIKLDTLTRPQSMALLRRLTGTDSPYYETIADEVGDLPLALQLAGNYLREYGYSESPQAYLEALRQHPLRHDSMRGRGSDGSPTDHALSLDATIDMSADKLGGDGVDPLAKRLLTYAAYLAPGEPIPRPLLLECAQLDDRRDGDDALKRLLDLGLLEGEADGALKLHRTIAAYARSQAADGEPQAEVERTLYNKASRLNKAGYPRELLPWQSHLRHVTDAAAARDSEKAADLCNELGYHLQAIGDYEGTRPFYQRALAINEKALGPDPQNEALLRSTATSLNNLGYLLQAMGNLAEARPYYQRALAIREKALGPDHPDTAYSLNNLAVLAYYEGDMPEAARLMRRALAIREKALGAQHPLTQSSRRSLAAIEDALP